MNHKVKKGIRLDLGCGDRKTLGFTGLDVRKMKGVDIVHNLQDFPYPLEDESCVKIVGSHIFEHINPADNGVLKFMDELWRIMEIGGQLAFAYPYGVGQGYQQDPTHINPTTQATWKYFDPGYNLYDVYKPKPWYIETNLWQETGQGEVLLTKITKEAGRERKKLRTKFFREENKARKKSNERAAKIRAKALRVDRLIKQGTEKKVANKENRKDWISGIIENREKVMHRLMYGVPMTGIIRSEWAFGRFNQVVPCNWSKVDIHQWLDQWSPLNYTVADARNIIATAAVDQDFEWVFFHDHDVILPQGTLLWLNESMIERKYPVISGIYFTKSIPSEPLMYRQKGSGYYDKWKFGDKVWVGYTHMGCTLIHTSILKAMYAESKEYVLAGMKVRKIFETPEIAWYDKEQGQFHNKSGTEDIWWSDRVVTGRFFDKAGWPEFQVEPYPFLCDTRIYCKHIDFDGKQFPQMMEDAKYEPERLGKNIPITKNDSKDSML